MVQIQFQIMNVNENAAKENWTEEQKKSNNSGKSLKSQNLVRKLKRMKQGQRAAQKRACN